MSEIERAKENLLKRFIERCKDITAEAIADGHTFQLAILQSVALAILLMCSRRAGKSRLCCGLLLLTAIRNAGSSSLYLGLTKGAAQLIWRRHWKPMLRKFKIYSLCNVTDSESNMSVEFPNGSRVVFGGMNDARSITHMLGDSMAGGIAIMDEQQSDPGTLEETAVNVIGPMISETTTEMDKPGRMVIAGTIPDHPSGFYWKLWSENYDEEKKEQKPNSEWQCYAWSRFENPHEKDNQYHLEVHLRKFKLKEEDPKVQRDWRGVRVWDSSDSSFGYFANKNQWNHLHIDLPTIEPFEIFAVKPPHGIDRLWIGIHPMQSDRQFAIEGFGTSSRGEVNSDFDIGAWHLFEAIAPEGVDPLESQWVEVIEKLREVYKSFGIKRSRIVGDPNRNEETNDVILRTHHIFVELGIKGQGSLKGRVDHVRNMNMSGELHILEGTKLEQDFIKAKWDKKAKQAKIPKWEFDIGCIPDAGHAATYVLPVYTACKRRPIDKYKGMSEDQIAASQARESFAARYAEQPQVKRRERPKLWGKNGFRPAGW